MGRRWREVKQQIEEAVDSIWLDEPLEIKCLRWGVVQGGAGTGGQFFTTLSMAETYTLLLGQRILYSMLLVADKPETDLSTMKVLTRAFTSESFHPTEFLADLGLKSIHTLGTAYLEAALDDLETKDDYKELTGSFFTYVERMHRWVHNTFPWNLGWAFPQKTVEEIREIARLVTPE